jgi:copper homeostasis protein
VINSEPVLEVIVCSVADAIEAEKGGAKRLEIISDFARGGMTPSVELVRDVLAAVSLPVRVMLRESENYRVTDEPEIERLCGYAHELAALEVDGLVLGFIQEEQVDFELCRSILSCAPGQTATFHHAFEETRHPSEAIEKLKALGQVDRILTDGGRGNWSQKIGRLGWYERKANPEIKILAGGGLNLQRIQAIRSNTGISEFHVGRAVRVQSQIDGPVQSALVHELVKAIEQK